MKSPNSESGMYSTTSDREEESQKGPKRFHRAEESVIIIVVILSLAVSLMTTVSSVAIIWKLRLFPEMQILSYGQIRLEDGQDPIGDGIILRGDTHFDHVHLMTNTLSTTSGLLEGNILMDTGHSSLYVGEDGVEVTSPGGLRVISPTTGKVIFPPDFSRVSLPAAGLETLSIPGGVTGIRKLRSPLDEDLNIQSDGDLQVKGSAGIRIRGRRVNVAAGEGLTLSTSDHHHPHHTHHHHPQTSSGGGGGAIIIDASEGVRINTAVLPMAATPPWAAGEEDRDEADGLAAAGEYQYKLCACYTAESGAALLFRVKVRSVADSCADIRYPVSANPCNSLVKNFG